MLQLGAFVLPRIVVSAVVALRPDAFALLPDSPATAFVAAVDLPVPVVAISFVLQPGVSASPRTVAVVVPVLLPDVFASLPDGPATAVDAVVVPPAMELLPWALAAA